MDLHSALIYYLSSQNTLTIIHKLMDQGRLIVPTNTLTCRVEDPGIEPETFRLVNDLLYFL